MKEPTNRQDGYIIPAGRPGLGIELNEAVAAAHLYTRPVFPHMASRLVLPRQPSPIPRQKRIFRTAQASNV
ncbi:MAG: hypothetical protein J4N99_03700 [Chloroflexi bacterium]|nr:hypothetical protein [Chloroflexota bacterium]MCI0795896.1 hypothetical protein [Chloroflexota bacterium]